MTEILKFSGPASSDKCKSGDPNTITTSDGDVLNVGPVGVVMTESSDGLVGGLGFTDVEAAINMRKWLQDACEAKGAKVVGSGYGFGQGDIDLEIEGFRYNVSIRPIW